MSIKSVAHLAHQRITSNAERSFKRTHFYELIAAAFGYGSYAALGAEAVLFAGADPVVQEQLAARIAAVSERCRELDYSGPASLLIASELCDVLTQQRLDVIRLHELVRTLREDTHPEAWDEDAPEVDRRIFWDDIRPTEPESATTAAILIESLKAAADRNMGLAHYSLALLYGSDQYIESDEQVRPYWYEQQQAGVVLEGVQIEWADAYEQHITAKRAFELHLRAATRLGLADAAVDLAKHFRDANVFDSKHDLSDQDPRQMSDLAASLGRPVDARRWLTHAAESGDTGAMRRMIEEHDADDLETCWKWLHLAKLFGVDLTADDYHAINEDGSEYDDDIGGPMYADGVDGIELAPIAPHADALARKAAQEIFAKARLADSTTP